MMIQLFKNLNINSYVNWMLTILRQKKAKLNKMMLEKKYVNFATI